MVLTIYTPKALQFEFIEWPSTWQWGLCALRHGIQISMEAILACHPARSTEWLDCHPKSCELWRIRTGPINPSDNKTWCAIMSTPGKLCLGSMVHLEFFLTTLCLVSSGFLANLFLISFCIQNRLRGNHCLRSPSFCTVCTVCPSRKWRRWYEDRNEKRKLVEEWTGSKLRSCVGLEVLFQLLPAIAYSPWQNIGAFMQKLRQL